MEVRHRHCPADATVPVSRRKLTQGDVRGVTGDRHCAGLSRPSGGQRLGQRRGIRPRGLLARTRKLAASLAGQR
ncbi:MAG: hypothetical protein ACRDND_20565 [Streptosporangiaceae bacterium]